MNEFRKASLDFVGQVRQEVLMSTQSLVGDFGSEQEFCVVSVISYP